jgi:hypothetical protein
MLVDTIKKTTETLIDASNETDLVVNAENTKYMLLSHHQNVEQTDDVNKQRNILKMRLGSDIRERHKIGFRRKLRRD